MIIDYLDILNKLSVRQGKLTKAEEKRYNKLADWNTEEHRICKDYKIGVDIYGTR